MVHRHLALTARRLEVARANKHRLPSPCQVQLAGPEVAGISIPRVAGLPVPTQTLPGEWQQQAGPRLWVEAVKETVVILGLHPAVQAELEVVVARLLGRQLAPVLEREATEWSSSGSMRNGYQGSN